jgi:hypothetical protein
MTEFEVAAAKVDSALREWRARQGAVRDFQGELRRAEAAAANARAAFFKVRRELYDAFPEMTETDAAPGAWRDDPVSGLGPDGH